MKSELSTPKDFKPWKLNMPAIIEAAKALKDARMKYEPEKWREYYDNGRGTEEKAVA